MRKLICLVFGHIVVCEVKRFDEMQYCMVYNCRRCGFEKTVPYGELFAKEFEQFKKAFREQQLGMNTPTGKEN